VFIAVGCIHNSLIFAKDPQTLITNTTLLKVKLFPSLFANVRLEWMRLTAMNAVAYCAMELITVVKIFVVQDAEMHQKQ